MKEKNVNKCALTGLRCAAARSRALETHWALSFIIISVIPFRFRWSIIIDVIFFVSFSFEVKSYAYIYLQNTESLSMFFCSFLVPRSASSFELTKYFESDEKKNAQTLRIYFLQIFWSNRQRNFIENSDSIVCRSMNVCSLMLFSFCSNKICAFNILSSVDHLNSIFPLIRIYFYRMQSNRFVMSEAATNSPSEYANEFNWNSRMNRVRLSLKSTVRFSWRNPPFDHIQGDQSGSPRIPAPAKLFRLIKNFASKEWIERDRARMVARSNRQLDFNPASDVL